MFEARSKDIVLRKVRDALTKTTGVTLKTPDFSASVYTKTGAGEMTIGFAETFVQSGGVFVYCESEEVFFDRLFELKQQRQIANMYVWEPKLQEKLHAAGIGYDPGHDDFQKHAESALTSCEALVARSGSIMICSHTDSGRRLSIYPEIHLVVARASQLVPDIKTGLEQVQEKFREQPPSMVSFHTGPSRTADIEKTLVRGAHGPKELILFLIDDGAH